MLKKLAEKHQERKAVKIYGDYYRKKRKTFRKLLCYYRFQKGCHIAIWGGGYKGLAFLKSTDPQKEYIQYVYDINEKKHNTLTPTGHPIVNYLEPQYQEADVVIIMNNNFETEIAGMLKEAGMQVILVNADSIICGNLSFREAIAMYSGRI